MRREWAPWGLLILRIALGCVWVYSGIVKVADPAGSLRGVRAYHLLPEWTVVATGYGLPFLELAMGALLIIGLGTRVVAAISTVLLLAFIGFIASAWARGLQIECGCFGNGGFTETTAYLQDIIRDLVLVAGSAVLMVWPRSRWAVDNLVNHDRSSTQRPRRELRIAASAVAILAVVAGAGLATQIMRLGHDDPNAHVPQGTVETYGIPNGNASAPVDVTLYEDFQCQYCAQMEVHIGPMLQKEADEGTVRVIYRPVAYLDHESTTDYSSRAVNAAACTQDLGGSPAFMSMHSELFAQQPEPGSAGLSNEQLVDLAVDAGVSRSTVGRCIDDGRFDNWVDRGTAQASIDGVDIVPVVLVNGERVHFSTSEVFEVTLQRLIDEAAG